MRLVGPLQEQCHNEGLDDIPYNFLIGDDGTIHEGRGYYYQAEISQNRSNSESTFSNIGLFVAFMGTFLVGQPSVVQENAFKEFLRRSAANGFMEDNYTLLHQDQLLMNEVVSQGILDMLQGMEGFHACKLSIKLIFNG